MLMPIPFLFGIPIFVLLAVLAAGSLIHLSSGWIGISAIFREKSGSLGGRKPIPVRGGVGSVNYSVIEIDAGPDGLYLRLPRVALVSAKFVSGIAYTGGASPIFIPWSAVARIRKRHPRRAIHREIMRLSDPIAAVEIGNSGTIIRIPWAPIEFSRGWIAPEIIME